MRELSYRATSAPLTTVNESIFIREIHPASMDTMSEYSNELDFFVMLASNC